MSKNKVTPEGGKKTETTSAKKFRFTKVVFDTVEYVVDFQVNSKKVEKSLSDVQCDRDICYCDDPTIKLDVNYLPRPNAKYPVIMEIHGGGFSGGDKKYRRCLSLSLAKNTGAAVVNVNYGLGENCPCPIPMRQLAQAVNWVAANAEKYHFDLNKFVVTGDSAGAYYACFLAVLQDSDFLQNLFECKINTRVTATVLNCGVYDMKHALNSKLPFIKKEICRDMTGLSIEDAQQSIYFEGLTLTDFVTEKFPPTMLIYAQNDLVCQGQGKLMLHKLQTCGVPTTCVCAKSLFDNHCFTLLGVTTMAKEDNRRMIRFLCEHFENA